MSRTWQSGREAWEACTLPHEPRWREMFSIQQAGMLMTGGIAPLDYADNPEVRRALVQRGLATFPKFHNDFGAYFTMELTPRGKAIRERYRRLKYGAAPIITPAHQMDLISGSEIVFGDFASLHVGASHEASKAKRKKLRKGKR